MKIKNIIENFTNTLSGSGLNIHNIEIPAEPAEDVAIPMGTFNELSDIDENLCISSCGHA